MTEGILGKLADREWVEERREKQEPRKEPSTLERVEENLALAQWLDAGTRALNDADKRELDDGTEAELRSRLEAKYQVELLAIISKAPATDAKYRSEWDKFVAYVKDAGVNPAQPRVGVVASYLDHLVLRVPPKPGSSS
jgi:hypothetical protein